MPTRLQCQQQHDVSAHQNINLGPTEQPGVTPPLVFTACKLVPEEEAHTLIMQRSC
jgi:hypothetical protein